MLILMKFLYVTDVAYSYSSICNNYTRAFRDIIIPINRC